MTVGLPQAALLALLTASLASCHPAPRDIVVVWRDSHLVVDFPWSLWRLVGLQDRTYCIRRIELFDSSALLWTSEVDDTGPIYHSCLDIRMPIRIGGSMKDFVSNGRIKLRSGVTYGIAISGTGDGRIDFTLDGRAPPKNEPDREKQIEPPCGSYFGECRAPDRRSERVVRQSSSS